MQTGIVASKSETVGLPLAGVEGRIFPIRRHRILDFDGGLRGMDFGGYGHYLEASGNAGVTFGPVKLQAGYRRVHVDVETNSTNPNGVDALLSGPLFSAQWRW